MEYFILKALDQANKSPMEVKFGAVLVYRNKIISSSYNTYKYNNKENINQCLLRG